MFRIQVSFLCAIVDWLIGTSPVTPVTDMFWGLYQNITDDNDPHQTIADILECNYTGYARQAATSPGLPSGELPGGRAGSAMDQMLWQCTGTVSNAVAGMFLSDTSSAGVGGLLMWAPFPSPRTISSQFPLIDVMSFMSFETTVKCGTIQTN